MPTAKTKEQERHQDYVFTAPTLEPGALVQGVPFQLDSDYPFELRSMAARIPYVSTPGPSFGTQAGLNLISARWFTRNRGVVEVRVRR